KASLQQILEQVAILPFLTLNDRCQQQEPSSFGQPCDAVDDLLGRLSCDRQTTLHAMTLSDASEEHAEIVEDLRDRPDGRARVPAGSLLLNRNRRREASD